MEDNIVKKIGRAWLEKKYHLKWMREPFCAPSDIEKINLR
jgi:hypothetical protein